MNKMKRLAPIITVLTVLASTPALSCDPTLSVRFTEAAPKDIFIVENVSTEWTVTHFSLDLNASRGNMLFDTAVGGLGQNVAQPFERRPGTAVLSTEPDIEDGDAVLELRFNAFGPGDNFHFSIDVDDRLAAGEMGQTMIGASEIKGALVRARLINSSGATVDTEGRFGDQNQAFVGLPTCS